jgi:hypothetical protein
MRKIIRTADATYKVTSISINAESGGVCVYYLRDGDNHTKQRRADSDAGQFLGALDVALGLVARAERGDIAAIDLPGLYPPPAPDAEGEGE